MNNLASPSALHEALLNDKGKSKMKDKKHIVVFEETKKDFEKMKDKKGMTQDGLVRYLIDKEKRNVDDGK